MVGTGMASHLTAYYIHVNKELHVCLSVQYCIIHVINFKTCENPASYQGLQFHSQTISPSSSSFGNEDGWMTICDSFSFIPRLLHFSTFGLYSGSLWVWQRVWVQDQYSGTSLKEQS